MAMKWDKCRFCDRSPSKRSCCTAVPLYRCKTTYRIIILLSDHRSKGTELATSDGRCSTLLRLLLPLPLPFTAISESGVSFDSQRPDSSHRQPWLVTFSYTHPHIIGEMAPLTLGTQVTQEIITRAFLTTLTAREQCIHWYFCLPCW